MNANVGMIHPVYAPVSAYTPGSAITYGTGGVVAEGVSANLTWEREDGHFYGDDVELDTANGVLGYTLEFEPSGLDDAVRAALLGEVASSDEYTITDDVAPDVGFGYVRKMRKTNATTGAVEYSYEGWWFHKLKFAVTREETRTKERTVAWRVPTLTGTGAGAKLDSSGKLKFAIHKTFSTETAAIAYVEGKAGISSTPATTT